MEIVTLHIITLHIPRFALKGKYDFLEKVEWLVAQLTTHVLEVWVLISIHQVEPLLDWVPALRHFKGTIRIIFTPQEVVVLVIAIDLQIL